MRTIAAILNLPGNRKKPGQPDVYALSYGDSQTLLFVRTWHDACSIILQTEHPRLVIRKIYDDDKKGQRSVNKLRLIVHYDAGTYVIDSKKQNVKDSYYQLT